MLVGVWSTLGLWSIILTPATFRGGYSREAHLSRRASSLHRFHRANEGLLGVTRGNRSTRRDSDLLNRLPERFHEVVVLHEALLDLGKRPICGLQLGGLPVPDGNLLTGFQFAYGVLEVGVHGPRVTVTENLVKRCIPSEESNDRVGEEPGRFVGSIVEVGKRCPIYPGPHRALFGERNLLVRTIRRRTGRAPEVVNLVEEVVVAHE